MAGNNPTSQVNYFYLASGASFSNQMDVRESVVHMSNVAAEPGPRTDEVAADGTGQCVPDPNMSQLPHYEPGNTRKHSDCPAKDYGSATDKDKESFETSNSEPEQRKNVEQSKRIRIAFLRDQMMYQIHEGEYRSAKTFLDEIKTLQNPLEVDILLLDAECKIHLGEKDVTASISRLIHVISECKDLSAEDVRKWAEQLVKRNRRVAGVLMYRISTDKRKYETADFDNMVIWIQNRMLDTRDPTKMLQDEGGESLRIVIDHVVEWRVAIWENLQGVTGANPDTKALCEARCACSITYACPDYAKSLRISKKGIEALKQRFGENVSQFKYYSWLLNNAGCSCSRLGKSPENSQYFASAVVAAERAKDHVKDERDHNLRKFRQNFRMASGEAAYSPKGSVSLVERIRKFI